MKCKACNNTLTEGEQTLDPRTKELNAICNVCLDAGMLESEFDLLKYALDVEELKGDSQAPVLSEPDGDA